MADQSALIELTSSIVGAYVSKNSLPRGELTQLIAQTYAALETAGRVANEPAQTLPLVPAVPVRKSVTLDAIICLEDGKKFKSLRRHLMTSFGMTPDEYRAKWSLPRDYPMVAPAYAEARSALAKTIGLGRKAKVADPDRTAINVATADAPKRGLKSKVEPREA